MRLRLSVLATVGSAALFSFAAACSSTNNQTPDTGGASSVGGNSAGGSGASGGSTAGNSGTTGGTGTGGQSSGGSGGLAAAGASAGHSSGGASGAGVSGSGGSGGQATGGASPGGASNGGAAGYPPVTDQMPTWDNVKLVLTRTRPPCNGADCHGAGGPNIFQLDASTDANLYMDLTTHISVDCGNIPVVTPGDVSKSALAKVLTTGCSANVPRMPKDCDPSPGGNCVPDDYIGAVVGWIAAGAPH